MAKVKRSKRSKRRSKRARVRYNKRPRSRRKRREGRGSESVLNRMAPVQYLPPPASFAGSGGGDPLSATNTIKMAQEGLEKSASEALKAIESAQKLTPDSRISVDEFEEMRQELQTLKGKQQQAPGSSTSGAMDPGAPPSGSSTTAGEGPSPSAPGPRRDVQANLDQVLADADPEVNVEAALNDGRVKGKRGGRGLSKAQKRAIKKAEREMFGELMPLPKLHGGSRRKPPLFENMNSQRTPDIQDDVNSSLQGSSLQSLETPSQATTSVGQHALTAGNVLDRRGVGHSAMERNFDGQGAYNPNVVQTVER